MRSGPRSPHGTRARYAYRPDPCRCADCCVAATDYHRRFRGHSASPCGTSAQYLAGCRCEPCRAARAAYKRRWTAQRQRSKARTGIGLRLPFDPLASRLGDLPVLEVARRVDVDSRQVYRWRKAGLTVDQADRLAVLAGFHPAEIWQQWGASGS